MNSPPKLLIADDEDHIREVFQAYLSAEGFEIVTACNGNQAVEIARKELPDLILMDITMPGLSGIDACKQLRSDDQFPYTPIILITALGDLKTTVTGLEAGAEEYLTKPVNLDELSARVKSLLRVKALHDKVSEQAEQLAEWNQKLERRVKKQVTELLKMGQLKQFFSPQIVEVLLASDSEKMLASHRQDITAVFCDLRGFTAFSEIAPPEELLEILSEYQSNMGSLIFEYEGTLEHFAGDGIMIFFNDPQPCPEHEWRAVEMALALRERMDELSRLWQSRGYSLSFGVGIATGTATLGMTGFEGRQDYSAIGPVVNLASRLSDKAEARQILITNRVLDKIADYVNVELLGEKTYKGFSKSVATFNVAGKKN